MVQMELTTTIPKTTATTSIPEPIEASPVVVVEKESPVVNNNNNNNSLLKTTLGLLLKHRGGPGFG